MYKYSLNKLQTIAIDLAQNIVAPHAILLYGNLGAGKTTFAQFFIKYLCGEDTVITSPTFNIIQIYNSNNTEIWHIDLYRIKNTDEVENLGIYEAINTNICIIEWPNMLSEIKNCTKIYL